MPSLNIFSAIFSSCLRARIEPHDKKLVIQKRFIPESLVSRSAGQEYRRLWERDWFLGCLDPPINGHKTGLTVKRSYIQEDAKI